MIAVGKACTPDVDTVFSGEGKEVRSNDDTRHDSLLKYPVGVLVLTSHMFPPAEFCSVALSFYPCSVHNLQ